MIKQNYFTEDNDIQTIFHNLIDWEEVVLATEGIDFADAAEYKKTGDERYAFAPANTSEALEYYQTILESFGELAGTQISQNAKTMDAQGLKFKDGSVEFPKETTLLFEKFREAGLIPYNIHRKYGGLGLPATVSAIIGSVITRGDLAFSMTLALLNLAQIIVRYGSESQSLRYVTKMATGEYVGAMSLTEPDFGSDLGSVITKAEKHTDGSYRITGTKRFISQGCGLGSHPCILLTMARTGNPGSGARGLSLFIVKSSDVEIAGIEKKLGIHSSPTCEIVYDNTPAEIIGREGYGLIRYTTGMTDFMRLGTATAGAGVGSAAYHEAQKYASERKQFGTTIENLPAIKSMLELMRRETNAMRLLCIEAGRFVDLQMHNQMRIESNQDPKPDKVKKETLKHYSLVSNLLTLLSKYYCSEKAVENANNAIQIHGGAGYTEEYDVARILRDARILTIYEGTSQIQVIGSIHSITAGMKETGFLRKFINDELVKLHPGEFLLELQKLFEESIIIYKKITDVHTRDSLARDVVDICVRFICALLFERAISKLDGQTKSDWQSMYQSYHIDSMAMATGTIWKLNAKMNQ